MKPVKFSGQRDRTGCEEQTAAAEGRSMAIDPINAVDAAVNVRAGQS
jgi:hypothetical protein